MNRLSSIVKDCLRGGVLLGAGVSSLVSGCSNYGNMVARSVGEYALMEGVAGAVRKEVEGPRGTVINVGDDDSMRGPVVPYDVKLLAYYRIKDKKTGEIEIVEGVYYRLGINWDANLREKYKEKYPDGYIVDFIEEGRLTTTRISVE